jgi:hypothetical protein
MRYKKTYKGIKYRFGTVGGMNRRNVYQIADLCSADKMFGYERNLAILVVLKYYVVP